MVICGDLASPTQGCTRELVDTMIASGIFRNKTVLINLEGVLQTEIPKDTFWKVYNHSSVIELKKTCKKLIFSLANNHTYDYPESIDETCRLLEGAGVDYCGLMCGDSISSDIFTINYQSLIIELLGMDNDEPVQPGEIGRVVVIDLYNRGMPLIRYDTGDLAMSLDPHGKIRHLERLCGRSTVCLRSTEGLKISSVAVCAITEIYCGIEKYQLIQNTDKDFVFKYSGKLSQQEKGQLLSRLHNTLGQSANIKMQNVPAIEAKRNGKFATIVNNCKS